MKKILTILLMLACVPAAAHNGHALETGFAAGMAHPFSGVDHLLAMIGIGLWGRKQGQPLAVALTFVVMMAAGALFQVPLPLPDSLLSATVLAVGVLLAVARLPSGAALVVVGLFALLHGQAHGRELAGTASAAGYLAASAALLMVGRCLGRPRLAGALIGAAGLCLLAVPGLA
jgi:urease accessory protein